MNETNNNVPLLIVSASAKSTKEETKLVKSIDYLQGVKIIQELNNSTGLSELYNRYITEEYRDYIIIFTHDDVIIEDLMLAAKLIKAHEHFDVVGVAGSTNTTIKSPAYWHLMADRKDLRGFCAHNLPSGYFMTTFGVSATPVDLIDGVFMSVKVSKLLDANVTFDEEFDFHFYDLAFSKRVTNAGLRLGVWPIFITHFSPGGGNQRWKDLEPRFIQKYS
jgi:GT2 family glycosyltransferase